MSKNFRSLVGIAAFVFAVLFTIVGGGQYWFLHWQLDHENTSYLRGLAEGVLKSIAFGDTWNLQGYRRTSGGPENYLVVAQNGTLIDTGGDYLRGMNLHVALPFASEYDHPVRFTSDVGEDWKLYEHKLSDGIVVLGTLQEEAPEGIDDLFATNAAQFGASVEVASRTPERKIDASFDYAIIDNNGTLLWATGGIPLKTLQPAMPAKPTFGPTRQINGEMYDVFLDPVVDRSGSQVGLITVLVDVTSDLRVLHGSAVFNTIVCALLWAFTIAFFTVFLRRVRPTTISCDQIPVLDEGETVEFKSSLRWDYVLKKRNKELERSIVKAVVGFLNSEKGGRLIIGLSDSREVLGLQADYATLERVKQDRDGFELTLRQTLIAGIGERRCARLIRTDFCSLQGKEICVVTVAPSSDPVFLKDEAGLLQLYVRVGNSTRPFGVQEALTYGRERWGGFALPRWRAYPPTPHPAG
jgi:hypothetical protein